MIVELGPPEPRESLRSWLLPVGLTALLLLAFGLASQPAPRVRDVSLPATRRIVLASARPVAHELGLPADLGQRVGRGAGGVTGMPTSAVFEIQETWWQYRLADGRDARFSRLPPGDAFIVPRSVQATEVAVRGVRGSAFATATSTTVLWTEAGATYQLSSRSLSVDELVRLADALVPD